MLTGIRRWFPLAVLLAALLAVGGWGFGPSSTIEAATSTISVKLTGASEVPPVSDAGSATATFQFNDQTNELTYTITVQGVALSDLTAAHIHLGLPGVSGPVLIPLTLSKSSLTSTGTVTLTDQEVAYLNQGSLYVNVHSVEHPNGFARAQLVQTDEEMIRARISAIVEAFNAQDATTFLDAFTDNGLLTTFGFSSRAEAEQGISDVFGGSLSITINSIVVNGTTATVNMTLNLGPNLERDIDTWVKVNGEWKLDKTTIGSEPIPANVRAVPLKLQEYAFVYDKSAVADGNFAFQVTNIGAMEHEVDLVKLAPGMTVEELVKLALAGGPDSPPPAGAEDIVHGGPYEPGAQSTIVLTNPLPAGNYALLCFMTDADGVPHVAKGMYSEFTVGATAGNGSTTGGTGASTGSTATGAGTGSITPPNTGDAGLKRDGTATSEALLISAFIVMFSGVSAFALSRRTSDR